MPGRKEDFSESPAWRNAPADPDPDQPLAVTNCTVLLDWASKPAGYKEGTVEDLRI